MSMKQYEYARFKMPGPTSRVGDKPDWEATELSWLNDLGKLGWAPALGINQLLPDMCGGKELFVREVEPAISITNEEIKIGGTS